MSDFPYEKEIAITAGNYQVNINYTFPSEPNDPMYDELKKAQQLQFCPVLFSLIDNVRHFIKLLTAVLLERSVVFVSDDLGQISSCVLALQSLI